VEDDTMDRAEPRQGQALDGASAPQPPAADNGAGNPEAAAVQSDGQRALPALEPPEQPERPRGRHEAQRRSVGGPAGAAIAVVIVSVVAAAVLATWLIGSAKEPPAPSGASGAAAAPTTAAGGPTSRPPGAGSFGNLVPNWSFEEDLSGWQVLGTADAGQEPQGRTSGSCASVRAREPGRVGLALPDAVPEGKRGQRYVASAWVRSTAPGQPATVRLVGGDGKESSKTTATTLPGLEWRRIIVAHTVATAGPLRLEIVADAVPAGDALLVDEVVLRLG
jgi:hypothetical protein